MKFKKNYTSTSESVKPENKDKLVLSDYEYLLLSMLEDISLNLERLRL